MGNDAAFGKQDLAVAIDHVDGALREQHAARAIGRGDPRILVNQHRKWETVFRREGGVGILACRVDPQNGELGLLELRPILAQSAKLLGTDRRVVLGVPNAL